MKKLLLAVILTLSAISAEAQEAMARPHFFDNWSFSLSGGVYHPMFYDIKYLVDCSGLAGAVELRKQVTPVLGVGLEANGYARLHRTERQDPRTVIGLMSHVNVMNLLAGYKGRPRVFEVELGIMPAWGRLYRGTGHELFPDENYFATKFGMDLNFNLGRSRAWTIALKPAIVLDVTSKSPTPGFITRPYNGYDIKRSDLQVFAGFTYHFRNYDKRRHFNKVDPKDDSEEIQRLNEIVNYLRSDIEQRDKMIKELNRKIETLEHPATETDGDILLPAE